MSTKTDRPQLKAEKRKIFGRKVKNLRKQNILPANIYGPNIKSVSIQTDLVETQKILSQVGETGLVDVYLKGEKKPRTVLLHNPQIDPITEQLIHLDFYQVNLSEKVNAHIPIELVGESPAAETGEGVVVQLMNEVEVEALPTDLPENILINISSLKKIDDAINVDEAVKQAGIDTKKVTVNADKNQLVVKLEAPTEEEKPVETEEQELPEATKQKGEEEPAAETETKAETPKESEEAQSENQGK